MIYTTICEVSFPEAASFHLPDSIDLRMQKKTLDNACAWCISLTGLSFARVYDRGLGPHRCAILFRVQLLRREVVLFITALFESFEFAKDVEDGKPRRSQTTHECGFPRSVERTAFTAPKVYLAATL